MECLQHQRGEVTLVVVEDSAAAVLKLLPVIDGHQQLCFLEEASAEVRVDDVDFVDCVEGDVEAFEHLIALRLAQ